MLLKKHHSGFTLVELLVALGIMAFVLVAVNNLFFSTIKMGKKTDVHIKLKEDGAYALNFMATKIRNTQSIKSGCNSSSLQFTEADGSTLTFSILNKKINVAVVFPPSSVALTSDEFEASGLNFPCGIVSGSPTVVTISFVLTNPAGSESEAFQTQVSLRNY